VPHAFGTAAMLADKDARSSAAPKSTSRHADTPQPSTEADGEPAARSSPAALPSRRSASSGPQAGVRPASSSWLRAAMPSAMPPKQPTAPSGGPEVSDAMSRHEDIASTEVAKGSALIMEIEPAPARGRATQAR